MSTMYDDLPRTGPVTPYMTESVSASAHDCLGGLTVHDRQRVRRWASRGVVSVWADALHKADGSHS